MTQKVVLGHIGTGSWGIKLLEMMSRFARVRSCYGSQNRDLLPASVRVVKDINAILVDQGLDAVVIASPPETHYELTRKCLHSGHSVFVEKPMCLTLKEAQDLVDLAQVSDLKIMVGFVYLYSNEYQRVKKAFPNVNRIKAYFMQSGFKHPTSSLINLGSHFVALALDFYNDNPVQVKVEGDDDSAVLTMSFQGKQADIYVSRKSSYKRREVMFMEDNELLYNWDILKANYELDNPLLNECRHFIDCLNSNSTPRTNELMGLNTIKAITSGVL